MPYCRCCFDYIIKNAPGVYSKIRDILKLRAYLPVQFINNVSHVPYSYEAWAINAENSN